MPCNVCVVIHRPTASDVRVAAGVLTTRPPRLMYGQIDVEFFNRVEGETTEQEEGFLPGLLVASLLGNPRRRKVAISPHGASPVRYAQRPLFIFLESVLLYTGHQHPKGTSDSAVGEPGD